MFNTPILDIVIGLIFVFLLYSLLVTAINEAIATSFGLRAKMLKKGIIESMLSDTASNTIWIGFLSRCWDKTIVCFLRLFAKSGKEISQSNLGANFYSHPLIRNYGSSEFYPYPSYIPRSNFSSVVIDVLKKDFDDKASLILSANTNYKSLDELNALDAVVKLKLLLSYYESYYKALEDITTGVQKSHSMIINKDTLRILLMHLEISTSNLELFSQQLENWFDDTMHRVTGWYKRQAQFILFFLGLAVAIIFNVDTIQIAGKLSKDKNLREQMVNAAIAYNKEHPPLNPTMRDSTSSDSITLVTAEEKWNQVNNLLTTDINDLKNLIAIGWDDYGVHSNEQQANLQYNEEYIAGFIKAVHANPTHLLKDREGVRRTIIATLYQQHWMLKAQYVFRQTLHIKKLFGLILTAFAISLGAPFWFDMLNKLVNVRGNEKKEAAADKAVKPAMTNKTT